MVNVDEKSVAGPPLASTVRTSRVSSRSPARAERWKGALRRSERALTRRGGAPSTHVGHARLEHAPPLYTFASSGATSAGSGRPAEGRVSRSLGQLASSV